MAPVRPAKAGPIDEVIAEIVTTGQQLHFSFTHNRAHALAFEVARQLRDSGSVDLVGTGLLEYATVLRAAGALRTGTSAFAGTAYPVPGRSPQLADWIDDAGDPHGTNLTVTLRLMAGALGLPALPTASLTGSVLQGGPGAVLGEVDGTQLQFVRALRPDVAFVHAPIADTDGNTLLQGPFGEDLWGAWAADAVIVSAERVVTPDELRAVTGAVGLPGHRVSAVVEAPMGAHPQAQFVWDRRMDVRGYGEDDRFRRDFRAAERSADGLRTWLEDWVIGQTHETYLDRLGPDRRGELEALGSATPGNLPAGGPGPTEPSAQEIAAIMAARIVLTMVEHDLAIVAGIGLSHLAAWVAAERARNAGWRVELVAETGLYGFRPESGDPYLFSPTNSRSAIVMDGFVRMLGALGGPAARRCVAVLGGAQIDRLGRINSSRISGKFIVGSGGANDLGAGAARMVLVSPLSPQRLVEEVDTVTTIPRHLEAVATDLGILVPDDDGELVLAAVVCAPGEERTTVNEARARCGFSLRTASDLHRIEPPDESELRTLRRFDAAREMLS